MNRYFWLVFLFFVIIPATSFAQTESIENAITEDTTSVIPPPVLHKPVFTLIGDVPDDGGETINLQWKFEDAQLFPSHIIILRSNSLNREFTPIDTILAGITKYTDTNVKNNIEYYYKLASFIDDEFGVRTVESDVSEAVIAKANLLNKKRLNVLFGVVIYMLIMFWYIYHASRKELFIRKIPGLAAIGEAVGRATEMGRPVLYVSGIGVISDVQTLASLVILGEVAKVTAQYDSPLMVPVWDPILMTAAEEIVRESHMDVGRPDNYNPDNIRYITADQFAYAAGVNGIMLRDRPAAIIYMGVFYAESLMLAETGFAAGAIQVAGTAMVSQIPFFIAACDYCLMGEELYAASAYLSKDPRLLANLKSSDIGKMIFAILTIIGVISATAGFHTFTNIFATQ